MQNDKFTDYQKHNGSKLEELGMKIRDLYKRFDPPIEKLNSDMGGVNGRFGKVDIRIVSTSPAPGTDTCWPCIERDQ